MADDCNHENAVSWNPFGKCVQCAKCKEVFFKAVITARGIVLVPVGDQGSLLVRVPLENEEEPLKEGRVCQELDLADENIVRESAQAAFKAVRTSGKIEAADLELFKRMALAVHKHLYALFTRQIPGGVPGRAEGDA